MSRELAKPKKAKIVMAGFAQRKATPTSHLASEKSDCILKIW